jgi:hypothetical protein
MTQTLKHLFLMFALVCAPLMTACDDDGADEFSAETDDRLLTLFGFGKSLTPVHDSDGNGENDYTKALWFRADGLDQTDILDGSIDSVNVGQAGIDCINDYFEIPVTQADIDAGFDTRYKVFERDAKDFFISRYGVDADAFEVFLTPFSLRDEAHLRAYMVSDSWTPEEGFEIADCGIIGFVPNGTTFGGEFAGFVADGGPAGGASLVYGGYSVLRSEYPWPFGLQVDNVFFRTELAQPSVSAPFGPNGGGGHTIILLDAFSDEFGQGIAQELFQLRVDPQTGAAKYNVNNVITFGEAGGI